MLIILPSQGLIDPRTFRETSSRTQTQLDHYSQPREPRGHNSQWRKRKHTVNISPASAFPPRMRARAIGVPAISISSARGGGSFCAAATDTPVTARSSVLTAPVCPDFNERARESIGFEESRERYAEIVNWRSLASRNTPRAVPGRDFLTRAAPSGSYFGEPARNPLRGRCLRLTIPASISFTPFSTLFLFSVRFSPAKREPGDIRESLIGRID